MKNWRTTSLGILTIITALVSLGVSLLKGEPIDLQEILTIIIGGGAGVGLVVAKDAGVTGTAKCLLPALLIPCMAFSGCASLQAALDGINWSAILTEANVTAAANILQPWLEREDVTDRETECIKKSATSGGLEVALALAQGKSTEVAFTRGAARAEDFAKAHYPDLMATESLAALAVRVAMRESGLTLDEAETLAALLQAARTALTP